MKNLDDEDIQRLIEEQLKEQRLPDVFEKNEDAALYRSLFMELENDPARMSESWLGERVVRQIRLRKERADRILYAMIITVVSFLLFGLVYGALTLANAALPEGIAHVFIAYKSIFIFIVLAFCGIQLLDRYIVEGRQIQ